MFISFGFVKSLDSYFVLFIIVNYELYFFNKFCKKECKNKCFQDCCCKKNCNGEYFKDDCCEKYIKICKEEFEVILFKVCKGVFGSNCNLYFLNIFIIRIVRVILIVVLVLIYYIVVDL